MTKLTLYCLVLTSIFTFKIAILYSQDEGSGWSSHGLKGEVESYRAFHYPTVLGKDGWKMTEEPPNHYQEFSFSETGQLKRQRVYNQKDEVMFSYEKRYDGKGRLQEFRTYDSSNQLISRIVYSRDKKGKIQGGLIYDGAQELSGVVNIYEDDSIQREETIVYQTESSSENPDSLINLRQVYTFDQEGHLLEMKMESEVNEYSLQENYFYEGTDRPQRSIQIEGDQKPTAYVYHYEDDEHGNWIRQYRAEPKKNYGQITLREINYF